VKREPKTVGWAWLSISRRRGTRRQWIKIVGKESEVKPGMDGIPAKNYSSGATGRHVAALVRLSIYERLWGAALRQMPGFGVVDIDFSLQVRKCKICLNVICLEIEEKHNCFAVCTSFASMQVRICFRGRGALQRRPNEDRKRMGIPGTSTKSTVVL